MSNLPTPINVPNVPPPVSATPAVSGTPASFAPSTSAPSFARDFAAAKATEHAAPATVTEVPPLPVQYEDENGNIHADPFGTKPTGENTGRHPGSPDGKPAPAQSAPVQPATPAAPQKPATPASPLDAVFSKLNFGEVTPATTTTPATANIQNGRDYTGFNDEEIAMFKAMSNESFNRLAPMYREHQQIKPKYAEAQDALTKAADVKFMASPEAFTLTPTYSVITRQTEAISNELSYWQDAYSAIRRGQDWHDLDSVEVDADNVPVKYTQSAAKKAGPEAELTVLQKIRTAEQLLAQQSGRLDAARQKHVTEYNGFYTSVEAPINALLRPVASNPAFQAKVQNVLKTVPPLLRGNPLVLNLVGLATFTEALLTHSLSSQGASASANLAAGATQSSVPSTKSATPTGPTNDNTIAAPGFSLADFKNHINNGRRSL